MEQEKNKSEEESSEEVEYETIRVPVNNAETPNYEKSFFLKGTNLFCDPKECDETNIKNLIENYVNIPEKSKEQFFERDSQTVRWKYEKNNKFASNAKLVEWSDGSYGVQIGNEIFDLALGEVNDTKVFSVYRNTLFIAQNVIKQKAICKSLKKN